MTHGRGDAGASSGASGPPVIGFDSLPVHYVPLVSGGLRATLRAIRTGTLCPCGEAADHFHVSL